MRIISGLLVLLCSLQAAAVAVCQLDFQQDWQTTPTEVVITGQQERWQISPDGQISQQGKVLPLTAEQQQLARQYQANLRSQLAWIDGQADQALDTAYQTLNTIIEKQFGADNVLHTRLLTLKQQFTTLKQTVLEKNQQGYIFHHQGLADIDSRSQQLANQALGGLLQDSINELGKKVLAKNGLQNLLGGLGTLQQQIQQEWQNQQQEWQQKGQEVCDRLSVLEQQRQVLFKPLMSK